MGLSRERFGQPILNLQYIYAYTSNDTNAKSVKLTISITGGATISTFINDPEVGTTNIFRFEVTKVISNYLVNEFPNLLNLLNAASTPEYLDSKRFTISAIELDANSAEIGSAIDYTETFYPYNFFRGQLISEFNPNSSGSTAIKFLTNAPNLRRVKYGDFLWLYGNNASYNTGTPLQEWVFQELDASNNIIRNTAIDYENPTLAGSVKEGAVGMPVFFFLEASVAILIFVRDKASPFTVRSEVKRYNKYTKDCGDYRLFWLNQYNATESIYLTGNKQRQIENNKQTFTQSEPVNANYNEGGIKSYANNFRYSYTLNTGRATPQEIKYFSEILYSRKTALLVDGVLIEVVLTDSDLRDFDEKDSVDNITFNFTEARQNTFL
tara:strand:- start:788 stop:1930 length:1143 start_codon:yes stop_codon:yes gene_type:complete